MQDNLSNTLEDIGKRIKALRIAKGYKAYRTFANDHDLEPKQYWRMESGKYDLKISSLVRLCEIHGISLEDLLSSD